MSILSLQSIVATAEIGGVVRKVGYDGDKGRLWVETMSCEEALQLLAHMGKASKQVTFGTAPSEQKLIDDVMNKTVSVGDLSVGDVDKKEKVIDSENLIKKETVKKETVVDKKPKKKTKRTRKQPESIQADFESMVDDSPTESVPPNSGSNGLSAELLAATSVRDVISILYDEGFVTERDISMRMETIKSKLPVLQRIKNIPDRVKRAYGLMALSTQ